MNITEYKTAVSELKAKQKELRSSGVKLLKDGLLEIFRKNPDLKRIQCGLNNHNFNDGDATYFALRYEECTFILQNDEEDYGYERNSPFKSLRDEVNNLFKTFDLDDFYENLLEKCYESVSFYVGSNGEITFE